MDLCDTIITLSILLHITNTLTVLNSEICHLSKILYTSRSIMLDCMCYVKNVAWNNEKERSTRLSVTLS